MSEVEIITDGGRRRRWSAAEKLRIVDETLDERTSISVVARRRAGHCPGWRMTRTRSAAGAPEALDVGERPVWVSYSNSRNSSSLKPVCLMIERRVPHSQVAIVVRHDDQKIRAKFSMLSMS